MEDADGAGDHWILPRALGKAHGAAEGSALDAGLRVWDAECEDGDRISVLVNGVPVIQNRTLFNGKESFEVDLPYESNTIEVYAENGGTDCPPGRTPPDETVNSGAISISNAVRGGQQSWRLRQRGGSTARLIVQP